MRCSGRGHRLVLGAILLVLSISALALGGASAQGGSGAWHWGSRWEPGVDGSYRMDACAAELPSNAALIFGGGRWSENILYNSVVELSAGGGWTELRPTGRLPEARRGAVCVYDTQNDRLVVSGGIAYAGPVEEVKFVRYLEDTWALQRSSQGWRWTELGAGAEEPGRRYDAAAIYDPVHQQLILFGGYDLNTNTDLGDTWSLDLSATNGAWRNLGSGGPRARAGHVMAYDAVNQRAILFGGLSYRRSAVMSDTWALDLSGNQPAWSELKPGGVPPAGYANAAGAVDVSSNSLVVVGGLDAREQPSIDVWQLALQSGGERWTRIQPTGISPGKRFTHVAFAAPWAKGVAIYGGWDTKPNVPVEYGDIDLLTVPQSVGPSPTFTRRSTPTATPTPRPTGPTLRPSATPLATVVPADTATRRPSDTPEPTPTSCPLAWPRPDLLRQTRDLLRDFYDREAQGQAFLAPLDEAEKRSAPTDPDSIWEALGTGRRSWRRELPSPACHAASSDADFSLCSAGRLALALGLEYDESGTRFVAPGLLNDRQAARGLGPDATYGVVVWAAQFATYHAFVAAYDAPLHGPYTPRADRAARDQRLYHQRMIRAYERHIRGSIIAALEGVASAPGVTGPQEQARSITRYAGWWLTEYLQPVAVLEREDLWANRAERREALELVAGLTQRVYWEWTVALSSGPPTAGLADLGSQGTVAASQIYGSLGTDRFYRDAGSRSLASLRPDAWDSGRFAGLRFDADYTAPSETNCQDMFAKGPDRDNCLRYARMLGPGGRSPTGAFVGADEGCSRRLEGASDAGHGVACGDVNLGSAAEEWLASFLGARAGARLIARVVAANDPGKPLGKLPPDAVKVLEDRAGYGVAGWHGGAGHLDDMNWLWGPVNRRIRTLSAGRHDGEAQQGQLSTGEDAISGDMWASEQRSREYPGAIENHWPGPNPVYGAALFRMVLGDKAIGKGLSPSLFDLEHRPETDQFLTWVYLLQSTLYECGGVVDPADARCLAYSTKHWPSPPVLLRRPLFFDPRDDAEPLATRYLWRRPSDLSRFAVASGPEGDGRCGGLRRGSGVRAGMPWRALHQLDGGPAANLVVDGGFGAYGLALQSATGFLRLAAARSQATCASPASARYALEREQVLRPWYDEMAGLVEGVLDLVADPDSGYGYIPDVENSLCFDPATGTMAPLAGVAPWDSEATAVHRAQWYSAAAQWYAWVDSDWLAN